MGALEPEVSALEEFGGAMSGFMSIARASGEMPPGFDKLESRVRRPRRDRKR